MPPEDIRPEEVRPVGPRVAPMANKKKLAEYRALVERDGEVCQWCGRGPTPDNPLHIDHIDPRGGESFENKQLLCMPCNSQKGNATEDKAVRWVSAVWQRGFTMIPNIVLAAEALSVYAFRVYSLLLYYARQDDACWPGQEGMARISKCSERQVREGLRELESAGLVRTRRRGRGETNVYILLVPRAARGAALAENGSEAPAVLDRHEVPTKKKQENKTQSSSPRRGRAPTQIGGARVTEDEENFALMVLAIFNEVSGKRFGSKEALGKIVLRHREHPELSTDDHRRIIVEQFEKPWWKGDPSPSVIYGNGEVFDRALNNVRGNGKDSGDDDTLDRYTRA